MINPSRKTNKIYSKSLKQPKEIPPHFGKINSLNLQPKFTTKIVSKTVESPKV